MPLTKLSVASEAIRVAYIELNTQNIGLEIDSMVVKYWLSGEDSLPNFVTAMYNDSQL